MVQGERDLAAGNRGLARFELRGVRPMPARIPRIEVTFLIDANGILNVPAKDLRSGAETSVEVRPAHGLSATEVERMIEESLEFAQQDVPARVLIDARGVNMRPHLGRLPPGGGLTDEAPSAPMVRDRRGRCQGRAPGGW